MPVGSTKSALPELPDSIEAVIRTIVRFKLRALEADIEDCCQEVRLQLLAWLRASPRAATGDLKGLAATLAWRVCAQHVRKRNPCFHALGNRIQYLLTRQAGFACWHECDTQVAGFAVWQGRHAPLNAGRLRAIS